MSPRWRWAYKSGQLLYEEATKRIERIMTQLPLEKTKVDELVRQCKHLNIFPIELGYRWDSKGKPHPVYDLLNELIEESVEYLRIMPDEEIWEIVDTLPRALTHSSGQKPTGPFEDSVLENIAEKYIIMLVRDRYAPLKDVFTTDLDSSEVLKIYPELRTKFDDKGLLRLDGDFRLSDNGIEYRNHVLHYHQLLRRGYLSQPNFDFLREFISYFHEANTQNDFRIAIDHRRIMPKEFFRQLVEFDTWYGPRFDKSKLDDPNPNGPELTVWSEPLLPDSGLSHILHHLVMQRLKLDGR